MLTTQTPIERVVPGMVLAVTHQRTIPDQVVVLNHPKDMSYPDVHAQRAAQAKDGRCHPDLVNYTVQGWNITKKAGYYAYLPPGTELGVIKSTKRILTREVMDAIPSGQYGLNIGSYAGSDPEVFAVDGKGEVIPAWEFLPGKKKALLTQDTHGGVSGTAYYDGFQAEFTTTPATCHGHLTDRVRRGMKVVWDAARKYRKDATLSIAPALPISRDVLLGCDPEHAALGCAPSMNVYGEERLAVPDPIELLWRFAGSHLHYGSDKLHDGNIAATVRMLDNIAGVMNVAMGAEYVSPERRRYYGRAGEFRWHPGDPAVLRMDVLKGTPRLEYRVPDTTILAHPATFNLFVDVARVAFRMGAMGLDFLWDGDEDETRTAINTTDVSLARGILLRNEKMFKKVVERAYGTGTPSMAAVMRVVHEGIGAVGMDPTDVVGNWKLQKSERAAYEVVEPDVWQPEGYRQGCWREFAVGVGRKGK